jgi:branched-subunit amino acid aminotransferase/4-amino-4-deoxychorismate lyase
VGVQLRPVGLHQHPESALIAIPSQREQRLPATVLPCPAAHRHTISIGPLAHLKHTGDFGQSYYGRLAERNGFGEALLTGPDGLISEGSMTNIGFFDGTAVVWPAAAMLSGITMQLVQARLLLPQRHSPVRVADLGSFGAVFIISTLKDCYESVPWEEV